MLGGVICDDGGHFTIFSSLILNENGRLCSGYDSILEEVLILDSVEELCDNCFFECKSISRITFNKSSSLKRIGIGVFSGVARSLKEVWIPERVEELCDKCFYNCNNLTQVEFGGPKSLKRIGVGAFQFCSFAEIAIPDQIEEICAMCFYRCGKL